MNTKLIFNILLLSLIYFISAKIGQIFGIGPGNVTPVWLPSGIMLFVIFWKGYKLLPGVFLGAAIGNGWTYISFENFSQAINTLTAASLNGIGDTLCVFLGVYFLKRISTVDNFFNSMSSIITFIIYGVLVGPLFSAVFGVIGLSIAGLVSSDTFWTLLTTWLIGDSVGVLLFTPLLIALLQNKWQIKLDFRLLLIPVFTVLTIFIMPNIPIISQFDILHILIFLIPVLIYISFKSNQLISLSVAVISSLMVIFSAALVYKNNSSINLNHELMSLQLFIFLLFIILLFFLVLINSRNQEEQKRIQQHDLMLKSRQSALEEMISMIAHQWRQPLSTINMAAANIIIDIELNSFKPDEGTKQLKELQSQVLSLSKTIDDFRSMHNHDKTSGLININKPILKAIGLLEKTYKNNDIKIVQELASKSKVNILEGEILQVILNLLNNSRDILINKRIKNPMVYIKTNETHNKLIIIVGDNAGGIDNKHIDKVFDAYYTTKKDKNGSGLGLYMSKIIIEQNFDGLIKVYNTEVGAEFIIELPLVDI